MDFSRLNRGEIIAGVGGALLIIALFLKWYGYGGGSPGSAGGVPALPDVSGLDVSSGGATGSVPTATIDGWDSFSFIDFVLFVSGLTGVALATLTAFGREMKMPFTKGTVAFTLGTISTLLVLWKIFDPLGGGSLKVGIFVALIGAAATAVGGYLTSLDDGDDLAPVKSARKSPARKKPAARRSSSR